MREFKFKGKAKMTIEEMDDMQFEHDNGWVYGNLIQNGDRPYIVGDLVETDPEYIVEEFWMPVITESIGQFTGLHDKNGKEIYEGDVIKKIYDWHDNDPTTFIFPIKDLRWDLRNIIDGESKLFSVYVIGNIYENPELLEN